MIRLLSILLIFINQFFDLTNQLTNANRYAPYSYLRYHEFWNDKAKETRSSDHVDNRTNLRATTKIEQIWQPFVLNHRRSRKYEKSAAKFANMYQPNAAVGDDLTKTSTNPKKRRINDLMKDRMKISYYQDLFGTIPRLDNEISFFPAVARKSISKATSNTKSSTTIRTKEPMHDTWDPGEYLNSLTTTITTTVPAKLKVDKPEKVTKINIYKYYQNYGTKRSTTRDSRGRNGLMEWSPPGQSYWWKPQTYKSSININKIILDQQKSNLNSNSDAKIIPEPDNNPDKLQKTVEFSTGDSMNSDSNTMSSIIEANKTTTQILREVRNLESNYFTVRGTQTSLTTNANANINLKGVIAEKSDRDKSIMLTRVREAYLNQKSAARKVSENSSEVELKDRSSSNYNTSSETGEANEVEDYNSKSNQDRNIKEPAKTKMRRRKMYQKSTLPFIYVVVDDLKIPLLAIDPSLKSLDGKDGEGGTSVSFNKFARLLKRKFKEFLHRQKKEGNQKGGDGVIAIEGRKRQYFPEKSNKSMVKESREDKLLPRKIRNWAKTYLSNSSSPSIKDLIRNETVAAIVTNETGITHAEEPKTWHPRSEKINFFDQIPYPMSAYFESYDDNGVPITLDEWFNLNNQEIFDDGKDKISYDNEHESNRLADDILNLPQYERDLWISELKSRRISTNKDKLKIPVFNVRLDNRNEEKLLFYLDSYQLLAKELFDHPEEDSKEADASEITSTTTSSLSKLPNVDNKHWYQVESYDKKYEPPLKYAYNVKSRSSVAAKKEGPRRNPFNFNHEYSGHDESDTHNVVEEDHSAPDETGFEGDLFLINSLNAHEEKPFHGSKRKAVRVSSKKEKRVDELRGSDEKVITNNYDGDSPGRRPINSIDDYNKGIDRYSDTFNDIETQLTKDYVMSIGRKNPFIGYDALNETLIGKAGKTGKVGEIKLRKSTVKSILKSLNDSTNNYVNTNQDLIPIYQDKSKRMLNPNSKDVVNRYLTENGDIDLLPLNLQIDQTPNPKDMSHSMYLNQPYPVPSYRYGVPNIYSSQINLKGSSVPSAKYFHPPNTPYGVQSLPNKGFNNINYNPFMPTTRWWHPRLLPQNFFYASPIKIGNETSPQQPRLMYYDAVGRVNQAEPYVTNGLNYNPLMISNWHTIYQPKMVTNNETSKVLNAGSLALNPEYFSQNSKMRELVESRRPGDEEQQNDEIPELENNNIKPDLEQKGPVYENYGQIPANTNYGLTGVDMFDNWKRGYGGDGVSSNSIPETVTYSPNLYSRVLNPYRSEGKVVYGANTMITHPKSPPEYVAYESNRIAGRQDTIEGFSRNSGQDLNDVNVLDKWSGQRMKTQHVPVFGTGIGNSQETVDKVYGPKNDFNGVFQQVTKAKSVADESYSTRPLLIRNLLNEKTRKLRRLNDRPPALKYTIQPVMGWSRNLTVPVARTIPATQIVTTKGTGNRRPYIYNILAASKKREKFSDGTTLNNRGRKKFLPTTIVMSKSSTTNPDEGGFNYVATPTTKNVYVESPPETSTITYDPELDKILRILKDKFEVKIDGGNINIKGKLKALRNDPSFGVSSLKNNLRKQLFRYKTQNDNLGGRSNFTETPTPDITDRRTFASSGSIYNLVQGEGRNKKTTKTSNRGKGRNSKYPKPPGNMEGRKNIWKAPKNPTVEIHSYDHRGFIGTNPNQLNGVRQRSHTRMPVLRGKVGIRKPRITDTPDNVAGKPRTTLIKLSTTSLPKRRRLISSNDIDFYDPINSIIDKLERNHFLAKKNGNKNTFSGHDSAVKRNKTLRYPIQSFDPDTGSLKDSGYGVIDQPLGAKKVFDNRNYLNKKLTFKISKNTNPNKQFQNMYHKQDSIEPTPLANYHQKTKPIDQVTEMGKQHEDVLRNSAKIISLIPKDPNSANWLVHNLRQILEPNNK